MFVEHLEKLSKKEYQQKILEWQQKKQQTEKKLKKLKQPENKSTPGR